MRTKSPSPELLAAQAGYKTVAGIDEAGRGPWAGPVVAAAVVLRRDRFAVPVSDSKLLSPKKREALFSSILEDAYVGVGIVPASVIDQVNILQATFLAMRRAVSRLGVVPDACLVDGNRLPELPGNVQAVVKGDRISPLMGAASIIAKVVRDRCMSFYDRLYPGYGFVKHKGYGTPEHQKALDLMGPCLIHRKSFRPVADRFQVARKRGLLLQ